MIVWVVAALHRVDAVVGEIGKVVTAVAAPTVILLNPWMATRVARQISVGIKVAVIVKFETADAITNVP